MSVEIKIEIQPVGIGDNYTRYDLIGIFNSNRYFLSYCNILSQAEIWKDSHVKLYGQIIKTLQNAG